MNILSSWTSFFKFRRAALAFASAGLSALLLGVTGCGHHHEASGESGPEAVEVEVTSPQRASLTRSIEQPGFLLPWEVTPIYTKISGFALKWDYDLGDWVKKDTLLLKLWVPEVEKDLEVKIARVDQAIADVKQAHAFERAAEASLKAATADVTAKEASIKSVEADVKRWEAEEQRAYRLFQKGVFDKATWDEQAKQLRSSEALRDEAVAKLRTSEAKEEQARANLAKARADVEVAIAGQKVAESARDQWKAWLDYREIRAPYDGLITLRNVAEGDFLQPANSGSTSKTAEPLYIMMRLNKMRCTVEVPEKDAVLLRDGDPAEVALQAMPGAPTIGYVKRNSGHLDKNSRTLRVEIHLENPDRRFLPNMYAKVTIKSKMPNAWSLPAGVVMRDILADKDRAYCFMVENGVVHKTFLEVGQPCDHDLLPIIRKQRAGSAVWENITGTETIVATNAQALLDEQKVRIKAH